VTISPIIATTTRCIRFYKVTIYCRLWNKTAAVERVPACSKNSYFRKNHGLHTLHSKKAFFLNQTKRSRYFASNQQIPNRSRSCYSDVLSAEARRTIWVSAAAVVKSESNSKQVSKLRAALPFIRWWR